MKRVALLLIRLYPANWRARYGEEFGALLDDSSVGFSSLFDLLRGAIKMQLSVPSFPKLALLLSLAGLLVGFGVSFPLTPEYVSQAVLTYEKTPDPDDAIHSLQAVQREVLSRTSLSVLIQDAHLDLYPDERMKMPLEDVIARMRNKDVKIRVLELPRGDKRPGAFVISYSYPDPRKAQKTVQALLTRFQESNASRQRGQAALHELGVVDSPSLPEKPARPNRFIIAEIGFAGGFILAVLIAIFRRRSAPMPFPAATA